MIIKLIITGVIAHAEDKNKIFIFIRREGDKGKRSKDKTLNSIVYPYSYSYEI